MHPMPVRALLASLLLFSVCACGGGSSQGESSTALTPRGGGASKAGSNGGNAGGASPSVDGGGSPAEAAAGRTSTAFDFEPGGPIPDDRLGDYHVVMGASIDGAPVGEMTFDFWPEVAPITVRNFLRLTDQGFYNGLTFHRVVRDFMIQGGCALGNGMGQSPLGSIKGEFHTDPEWRHQYGVLSMARGGGQPDSGGSQFFLINEDGASAWSLDGDYASFGRMTSGVATLEALSDIPVVPNPMNGEPSKPTQLATIEYARVIEGPAPTGEVIERPVVPVDLKGAPEKVHVHSMLIGFKDGGTRATRSREEAEALAGELLKRVEAGEDFEALAREYSDDPLHVGMTAEEEFFGFRLLNHGVRDSESERRVFDMNQKAQAEFQALSEEQRAGNLSTEVFTATIQQMQRTLQQELRRTIGLPREQLGSQYGVDDVAFSLEVGEAGLVETSRQKSRTGWYVIQRID